MPRSGEGIDSDDEYDPNEELLIGHIELNEDKCILRTNQDISLQVLCRAQRLFRQKLENYVIIRYTPDRVRNLARS